MADYYDPYMDDQQQEPMGISSLLQQQQPQQPTPLYSGDQSLISSPEGGKSPWWAKLIAGGLAAGGTALAAKSGQGGEFLANAVSTFANEKSRQAAEQRQQKFQQDENLRKTAHDTIMKFQGQDLGKYPELQRLQKRYQEALGKDSPGGSIITPREAADIIAHGQVASSESEKLQREQAHKTALQKAQDEMTAQQEVYKNLAMQAGPPGVQQPSEEVGPGTGQDYATPYPTEDQEAMQQFAKSQMQRMAPERQATIMTPQGPMTVPISEAARFAGTQIRETGAGERQKSRLEEQRVEAEKNRQASMDRLTAALAARALQDEQKAKVPNFGESVRTSAMKGVKYISGADFDTTEERQKAATWARDNGIPYISKDNGSALVEVGNAIQDLQDAYQGIKAQMPSTVAGTFSNRALSSLQWGDEGAALKAYNDTIADIAIRLGRATSGKSGLRFNRDLIQKMINSIPNPTQDTARTAEEKMSRLNTYLKNVEEPILGPAGKTKSQTLVFDPTTGEFVEK